MIIDNLWRKFQILNRCVLMFLFLFVGISCTNVPAYVYYEKIALKLCMWGKFEQAKEDFEKILLLNAPYSDLTKYRLEISEDAIKHKLERKSAAHIFKGIYNNDSKKNPVEAIAEFNKAIAIEPSYAITYVERSSAYLATGSYEQAISDCNKAIELNPGLAYAYLARAVAYTSKNLRDSSTHDLNRAIELNPMFSFAYVLRGINYLEKNLDNQAILDFNIALSINPNLDIAYFNRGLAYDKLRHPKEAVEDYTMFLQCKSPQTPISAATINEVRKRIKDMEKYLVHY